jgi:hypothetical protein
MRTIRKSEAEAAEEGDGEGEDEFDECSGGSSGLGFKVGQLLQCQPVVYMYG